MSSDPQNVQALFSEAIEIEDPAQREAYVVDKCAENQGLYQRLAQLLAAHDQPREFLDPPSAANPPSPGQIAGSEQAGQIVAGRYKLLEEIGEGGMGMVWVAEQTHPVRRKVALKLVKPGMDSKQVLARFDAERQALALMDHPNIAKVFDGGVTEQGRPFFAMEYVKGMPLTQYCDQMRLPVEERLRLFIPICQAVQHAHQKGIIHRDLKPSNVLICLYDGKPVPKVIDFGLAKAMVQPLTEQTVHTGHGFMIGTPLYMSPEQAEHNNLDVDTRSDVYSLGVMLYEVLTGSTPLEQVQFKDAALGEILRLIKEVDPPKPSTRVSGSAQLPNIAAQRNLDPAQLGRRIRGDLDRIVMKSIEKERDRRYESPSGLARDIERYLNMEPVEACPPSTAYRLRRLARKHRAALTTAVAIATIVFVGAILSTWQAIRATKAESLASKRLVEVEAEQRKTKEALDTSQVSERRALESKAAAVAARLAEEDARAAEAEQRLHAEQQRDEAEKLRQEAIARSNELQQLTEQQRRVIYASEMNQVRIEAERGNLARMREILLNQLPIDGKQDLRGFEWNYWYRYLNQAQLVAKYDQADSDSYSGSALLRILPGGKRVAWTREDQTHLVDLDTGSSHEFPYALRHYINRPRFSVTGRAVVGAANSLTAYYIPETGPTYSFFCNVFEPTGDQIHVGYPRDTFSHLSQLNISRDGKRIVALGNDVKHSPQHPLAHLCVWDVDSKKQILDLVLPRELNRAEFSHDGRKIAAYLCHGSQRHADVVRDVVVVIDIESGREEAVMRYDDDLDLVVWLPDSTRLLLSTLGFSGSNRKQLLSWSLGSEPPLLLTREEMPDFVIGDVSPDGHTLAVTSHTVSNVRLIDTTRGDVVAKLQTEGKPLVSLTFSLDGKEVLCTTKSGEVLRWEVGTNQDLFALRTRPVPQLFSGGYALTSDQSLLALALADGTLLTRSREGAETTLKRGLPGPATAAALIVFSPDNHYLAILTQVGPDGKLLAQGKELLEVYDLRQPCRLWQTHCKFQAGATDIGKILEFSADGTSLVHVDMATACVWDVETGKGSAIRLQDSTTTQAFPSLMGRDPDTGGLFAVVTDRLLNGEMHAAVCDPVTGQRLHSCSIGNMGAGNCFPAPDGEHCWVFRLGNEVEVWNVRTEERVLSVPGTLALFSPDGSRLAIADVEYLSAKRIRGLSLWDLATRTKLCDVPIEGDPPDEVRFSPDGTRCLTLHGRVSGSNGKVPRGRLWDVETGREILDLPVAAVNHYKWDLLFSPTGEQLTQLLFSKAEGTVAGGATVVYDATPLEASLDDQLSADRLVAHLGEKYAFKQEWVAEIESRAGLKPGIRDRALAMVHAATVDPNRIAKLTGDVVGAASRPTADYERALLWAQELDRLQPQAVRSQALLGAAYYRLDRLEKAHAILAESRTPLFAMGRNADRDHDMLRRAVLSMVYLRQGDEAQARKLSKGISVAQNRVREAYVAALISEATTLLPELLAPADVSSRRTKAELDRSATSMISLMGNDGEVAFDHLPPHILTPMAYDTDQDKRLNHKELVSYLRDHFRHGSNLTRLGRFPLEAQLEYLDATIREAPRYLPARFFRAWVRATHPEASRRNATGALADAKEVCELTNYRSPAFLEVLAAAYAESGEFDLAVHWQSEAIRLGEESAPGSLPLGEDSRERLANYQKNLTFRTTLLPGFAESLSQATSVAMRSDASAPLIAPDVAFQARRLTGFGAAWSPDGRKIVRNLKIGDPNSGLELIDLETGETKLLCEDGADPVWTSEPFESIFFARGPAGSERSPRNETIWRCDTNGENLQKVCEGGFPSLASDGRLFVRQFEPAKGSVLRYLDVEVPPKSVLSDFRMTLPAFYPPVSPDGKLVALSGSNEKLRIVHLDSRQELRSVDLSHRYQVFGGWSPDSRYFAYGASDIHARGLWILDVTTGENVLLADIAATNPRWSPDGRFLAADERAGNNIVILDLEPLELAKGVGGAR